MRAILTAFIAILFLLQGPKSVHAEEKESSLRGLSFSLGTELFNYLNTNDPQGLGGIVWRQAFRYNLGVDYVSPKYACRVSFGVPLGTGTTNHGKLRLREWIAEGSYNLLDASNYSHSFFGPSLYLGTTTGWSSSEVHNLIWGLGLRYSGHKRNPGGYVSVRYGMWENDLDTGTLPVLNYQFRYFALSAGILIGRNK